jgi:hypothetical protein
MEPEVSLSPLKDHPLSAVRNCLFSIFAATLHIWRPSSWFATQGRTMPLWKGAHLTWLNTTRQIVNIEWNSWNRVIFGKIIVAQLLYKFAAFYWIPMFITASHLSLQWVRWIHSILIHKIPLRSVSILWTKLCLRLPSVYFFSDFPTKIVYAFIIFLDKLGFQS